MLLIALLAGCGSSNLGKTLVFALDGEVDPTLDRDTCGTGVGLAIPLGIEASMSFAIARDGSHALLGSCVLDEGRQPISCGTLVPEVRLEIEGEEILGTSILSVGFEDTNCSGGTLDNLWTFAIDDTSMAGTLQATWGLDDSNACEDFEADIIAASGNGRGVEGCVVDYAWTGEQVARCDASGDFLDCEPI